MNHTILRHLISARTAVLAGSLLFSSVIAAQTPAYFPLQVGNTWLYRSVSINSSPPGGLEFRYQSIQVRGTEKIGETEYFDVSYFGREVALRVEPSTGDVLLYDPGTETEKPWVSLSLPVGSTFPSNVNPCPLEGQILSRTGMVDVPVGDFPDVIHVKFRGGCGDAGVTTQYYAPNVGLIRDEESDFGRAVVYRLAYYRVGNSGGLQPEVSFTVAADSPWYFTGTFLAARITLRNTAFDAVSLHFPTEQSYDLKILNDQGDVVYLWSEGKDFGMSTRDEKLASPREITYGLMVPLEGLAPGRYVAQAYLTTDPVVYFGQVGFEIVAPSGGPSTTTNGLRSRR